MATPSECHVAVIGAGPAGLSAIKSLMEEGFHVSAFEKRDGPGGIWHYTADPNITSVTTKTRSQLSRFLTPFSDFPHAPGTSRHPTGEELGNYYQQYADHFNLSDKITYGVIVESIRREDSTSKWLISIKGESSPRLFDKVVIATGGENGRRWPTIENIDAFEGTYIHGQEYKGAEKYAGKNVIVVGQGNSAGDCAVELSKHAKRVHIAHRRGALVLPRIVDGMRFDHIASWKLIRLGYWLSRWLPPVHRWAFNHVSDAASKSSWGKLDPSWNFDHEYRYATNIATFLVSDSLIPALRDGTIISVPYIKQVVGPRSVQLTDDSIIDDVDCIIACTGYESSMKHICDAVPYSKPAPDINELPHLYQNIFPVDHADSLAFVCHSAFMENVVICRELAAMAVAQIWAGKSTLPPREDMVRQIQGHLEWYAKRCRDNAPVSQLEGVVEPDSWLRWVHDKAGTGMYDKLGWTFEGVKFSLLNPRLYWQLAYGVGSPHLFRLFETGKRKAWPGAMDAIKTANRESVEDLRQSKKEWEATKAA